MQDNKLMKIVSISIICLSILGIIILPFAWAFSTLISVFNSFIFGIFSGFFGILFGILTILVNLFKIVAGIIGYRYRNDYSRANTLKNLGIAMTVWSVIKLFGGATLFSIADLILSLLYTYSAHNMKQ